MDVKRLAGAVAQRLLPAAGSSATPWSPAQVNSGSQQQSTSPATTSSAAGPGRTGTWCSSAAPACPGTTFPNPAGHERLDDADGLKRSRTCTSTAPATTTCSCPGSATNSQGASWTGGSTAGSSLPISSFFLAHPGDSAATIKRGALAAGQNMIFTPGIYNLNARSTSPARTPWCSASALATLVPSGGASAIHGRGRQRRAPSPGCSSTTGTTNSSTLVQVGPSGYEREPRERPDGALRPVLLPHRRWRRLGKATQTLQINIANVIGDDLWLWRAGPRQRRHGRLGQRTPRPTAWWSTART